MQQPQREPAQAATAQPAPAKPRATQVLVKEEADGAEMKMVRRTDSPENLIHVRNNQTAVFYSRLGAKMMFGTEKPTQNEVIITGLGRATGTAVGAAAFMCNDERVRTVSVKTELWESLSRNRDAGIRTTPPPRRIPKITITLQKVPGATGGLSPITNVSTVAAESPNAGV